MLRGCVKTASQFRRLPVKLSWWMSLHNWSFRRIRLMMLRIADERRLPVEVKAPNAFTRKAMAELEAGKGKRFGSVKALMADLHADD